MAKCSKETRKCNAIVLDTKSRTYTSQQTSAPLRDLLALILVPCLTSPYLTLPYLALPYLTVPTVPTLPYLPYLTLPYLTLPYLNLPVVPGFSAGTVSLRCIYDISSTVGLLLYS